MISMKINRTMPGKPSFTIYFKTLEDATAFTDFQRELIEAVKLKVKT
jgi:hypothetical protein